MIKVQQARHACQARQVKQLCFYYRIQFAKIEKRFIGDFYQNIKQSVIKVQARHACLWPDKETAVLLKRHSLCFTAHLLPHIVSNTNSNTDTNTYSNTNTNKILIQIQICATLFSRHNNLLTSQSLYEIQMLIKSAHKKQKNCSN